MASKDSEKVDKKAEEVAETECVVKDSEVGVLQEEFIKLYNKILNVMRKVKGIEKKGEVSFKSTKYAYQREEDITAAIREACIEEGLVIIPIACHVVNTTATNVEITMGYKIVDADTGEYEIIGIGGEGQDNGDKKMYKALTGAYKYMQKQVFHLTSQENDPDDIPSPEAPNTTASAPDNYLDTIFPGGKHKGKALGEVAKVDAAYIVWLAGKQGDMQGLCQRAVQDLKLKKA
jgi:hypothetical protein